MRDPDVLAELAMRRSIVADVRRFAPSVRIGDATLEIMIGWRQHGDRWMVWTYGPIRIEGYHRSANGAHAAGWRRWLEQTMTGDQWEAFQDGDASRWAGGHDRRAGMP